MPRKKSDKASQTADGLGTSVKPLEETENTSSNSDSIPINGETSEEALKEQVDDKPKKKRKSVPKRIIHIVLDAGRSRIKVVELSTNLTLVLLLILRVFQKGMEALYTSKLLGMKLKSSLCLILDLEQQRLPSIPILVSCPSGGCVTLTVAVVSLD